MLYEKRKRSHYYLLIICLYLLGIFVFLAPLIIFNYLGLNDIDVLGGIYVALLVLLLLIFLSRYNFLIGDRIKKLKEIAKKYHLEYIYSEKRSNWTFNYYPIKKNILVGEINQQKIEIFDYHEIALESTFKSTVLIINDDIKNKKVFGICSAQKIEEILADIKDNNSSAYGGGEKR